MGNRIKKVCICLLMLVITVVNTRTVSVKANLIPPSEYRFTPKVLTEEITDRTGLVLVYVFDNTTLYIKNGSNIVYKKFYAKKGLKEVKIEKQKGGCKLKFYLIAQTSGKKGDVVTKKVIKLPAVAPEQLDPAISKPIVPKRITRTLSAFILREAVLEKGYNQIIN